MLKPKSFVRVLKSDERSVEALSDYFADSRVLSKLMVNRGIVDIEDVKRFLDPKIENFIDPFMLNDMEKAVDRILKAIHKNESIWIYGDYDVDGVTSTSILILFLKSLCSKINFYIPERMTEGYGMNSTAIDYIKSQGGQLIISVDCGISSFEEAQHCKEIGVDLIITDHHSCSDELPEAVAVINPNRLDSNYPFRKLAGVGVALKLIQAIALKLDLNIDYNQILPIAAIGTVADVVSLTEENRIIVKNGLDIINKSDNLGIKALLEITGLNNKKITSGHIGFVIGPRINAIGRIGRAEQAVKLFITEDYLEAKNLAKTLDEENTIRQNIESNILMEAEEIIEKEINLEKNKVIVIASENWHSGVIGIVSSRITEKYKRPSILIAVDGDEGRGSARSIPNFNLYDNLNKCKDLLLKFGGHSQAAGLTISKENISCFRKKINEIADEVLEEVDLIPEIIVDAEINEKEATIKTVMELEKLEPFGIDNPSPIFLLRDALVKEIRFVGKESKHLKMLIESRGKLIDVIGFSFKDNSKSLKAGQVINLIFTMSINEFCGQTNVQFVLREIVPSYIIELWESNNYINSFLSIFDKLDNIANSELPNLVPKNLSESERSKYIIDIVQNEDNILIIVNNVFNLAKILCALQYEGREFFKRVSFNYNRVSNGKNCDILIHPYLDQTDLIKYKKVIIYDMCFSAAYFKELVNYFQNNTLEVLNVESDYNDIIEFYKKITPEVFEIRLIYKTFINKKEEFCKIEIDKYLKALERNNNHVINKYKFITILKILEGAKLIEYVIKNNFLYVKILESPQKKFDITKTQIYNRLRKAPIDLDKLISNMKSNNY